MVIIIPYKRSTLESLEPTWIVLMSELTFASSRTGGMGRIMISMGTRWTSFTATECTLLSETIARNDICIKQHTTTTSTKQMWRLERIAIAGTLQAALHDVVFSMLSKVGKMEWMGFWTGERNQRIASFSKWIFENMPTTALGTGLLFFVWRLCGDQFWMQNMENKQWLHLSHLLRI